MTRKYLYIWIINCAIPALSVAQRYAPFIVRTDLAMPLKQGAGAFFEWRYQKKHALVFQAFWETNAGYKQYDLFHGDLLVDYTRLVLDTVYNANTIPNHRVGESYIGDGRPVGKIPSFVTVSRLNLKIGKSFVFGKDRSRWQWSVLPSFSLLRHHYFAVDNSVDSREVLTRNSPYYNSYPFQWYVKETYYFYTERVAMREKKDWVPGLSYDVGVSRILGARWLVELRASGWYNLDHLFNGTSTTRATQAFQVNGHLCVGFMIGKIYPKKVPEIIATTKWL